MDDERQKDARAAALLGWEPEAIYGIDYRQVGPDGDEVPCVDYEWVNDEVPRFGTDRNAAALLVAALPPEARERFGAILLSRLDFAPLGDVMALVGGADVWRLLNDATPAQLRDACLESL